jgi:hypothetical protein
MTRVLTELLGAREPAFHLDLQQLERVSGRAGADIRLTAEIERAMRVKLAELGLHPTDTTGAELYHALLERVRADDAKLTAKLKAKYGAVPGHVQTAKVLADLPISKQVFGLKSAVAKRLLHKQPPKQAMRALGYRSFDSLLRREQLLTIVAAAWLLESNTWRKATLDEYKKLQPADFEIRSLTVLAPHSPKWQKLAEVVVAQKKHNVVPLREYGALVVLPLPKEQPPAATFVSLLIALHDLNEVKASSTYLKLSQVRSDFGACVQAVAGGGATLPANLLSGPVSWNIIQRYYARFSDHIRAEVFEPHVQKEDLTWHSIEKALALIDPGLAFWQQTAALGLNDKRKPVSMNVIDAALNFCNQLTYEDRLVGYFRRSLWDELTMRYLKAENVEQAVVAGLTSKLAAATVPAEDEFEFDTV